VKSAPSALGALLGLLDLEQLEVNRFRGQSLPTGFTRVYGGQVLAQSLVAAQRTVDEMLYSWAERDVCVFLEDERVCAGGM
jgi:acyl-CoA thioesterase